MPNVADWYYHRKNCESCGKSEGYLNKRKTDIRRVQDARKERLGPAEALALARGAERVVGTKGRALVELNMKAKPPPSDKEVLALLIGPSGKMRAPALRLGKVLVIGFSEEMYAAALK